LKGINLAAAPGELVEITGPSGSGKTTLLRLVHGQVRPNAGEVWVGDHGLHRRWRRGLGAMRRDVAFVFQEQRLLPRLSALENIVLALQIRDPQVPNRIIQQRALQALESVKLAHRKDAHPHQLSAGERQRVAIARALSTRPHVLLVDEPLAGIDVANAEIVTHLLEEAAAGGTTVIVASHRHTFRANRILRLPSGKVAANGARWMRFGRSGNGQRNGHMNGAVAASDGKGNGHAGVQGRSGWWRIAVPRRERPPRVVRSNRIPPWRRAVAFGTNSYRLVVLSGLRSWSRDLRQTAPVLGLVGVAVQQVVAAEAAQASVVRIYIKDGTSMPAIYDLRTKLLNDPRVASVRYVSPEQALAEARSRPGLDQLTSLSSANPFPASLDVRVRTVTQVSAVAESVRGDPAVDPAYPTSYDPDTYSRLRRFALIAGGVAGGIVLIFAVVAYAVIANAMRGVTASRRHEVGTARLLGARGWMLRGPFVVEGMTTGALAGALAAGAVAAAYLLATRFESSVLVQLLPGVGLTALRYVLAAVITAGLVLGAATAMLGFRRAQA
jgi:putative ABC transport system ATP-binding protein